MTGSKQAQKNTVNAPKKDSHASRDDADITVLGNANFDQEPQSGLRAGWLATAIVGFVLFAVTTYIAHAHTLTGAELAVFRFINGWPEALRPVFLVITTAPESLWIGVVLVLATFSLKLYRVAWQLAAATVGGYAITYIAKELVGRERPVHLVPDVHTRVLETSNGFPSGHTMMITVAVLALWPYLPKRWRYGVALLIPLMGLSRIYLGVHSPLDIVGGFAVGAFVVGTMRALPVVVRKFFRFD